MSWILSKKLVEEILENSLYLQDTEEVSLEENSLDGKQCVGLKLNHMQPLFCAKDKMKDFSKLFLSGTIFEHSMEDLGLDESMLFREDPHVRTLASLEKEMELSMENQPCGSKCLELLAKYDPNTCSWKTAQCLELEGLDMSFQDFPRRGIMLHGMLYQLENQVLHMNEKECGQLVKDYEFSKEI